MFRILVVQKDGETRGRMAAVLMGAGFEPLSAANGLDALEILKRKHVDLVILGVTLPKMDGFELLGQLRGMGCDIPVMMVTARQAQADKKRAFLLGADDYMIKPADEEEMLLRIGALLRRARVVTERKLTVGSTLLVYDSFSVERNGKVMELPKKEFLLLYKLLSCNNKTFSRRQLMDEIWDMDSESDEHTVVVHINRLRERFRNNRDFEIQTVRGLGYKAVRLC